MKNYVIFFVLLITSYTSANSEITAQKEWSKDGRNGTLCPEADHQSFSEVCELNIFQLLANPEQYDKKTVSVSGYLTFRVYYRKKVAPVLLYSERLTERSSDQILMSSIGVDKKLLSQLANKWVTIVGKFNSVSHAQDNKGFAGELAPIYEILPLSESPSALSEWEYCWLPTNSNTSSNYFQCN